MLGLSLPLATKVVVDHLVPDGRHDLLGVLGAAVLGITVMQGALSVLRSRMLLRLRALADEQLTGRFVTHLLRLPLGFFLQRSRGDLLMRLSSVSTGREAVTQHALTMCLDGLLLIVYVTTLTFISPWYVLIVGTLAALQICLMLSSYNRVSVLTQRELTARAEEQGYLIEALQAMLPVKANGVETQARRRWHELFGAYQVAMLRRGRATSWFEGGQTALSMLAPLSLLWCGVWLVLSGQMSLGSMLAANTLAMSVLSPLMAFVGVIQLLSMLRGQIERIYDVFDSAPEASGDQLLPGGRPVSVQARDVTFRYAPESPPVVRSVSFTVPAGAKLGVVGRTGSGKSTLALLVLGLLRAEAGTIRHDGIAVDDLDVGELRRGCGAVLQELSLFNGTIRDNITLGSPDATDADVADAATMAGLHEDVLRLPMGYRTTVGEGGASLSAGQRQRVALARALVHRPRLLILDEATSHLDPETERRVDAALSALRVTRIVISHRLSAIRNADEIVVMREGRVAERGKHEELVNRPGVYHELFADVTTFENAGVAHPALPSCAAPVARHESTTHRRKEPSMSMEEARDLVRSWKDPDFREDGVEHPSGDISFTLMGAEGADSTPVCTVTIATGLASCWPWCAETAASARSRDASPTFRPSGPDPSSPAGAVPNLPDGSRLVRPHHADPRVTPGQAREPDEKVVIR
ncbi:peptidase domain-containing ABC transporter [Streptosporangium lutulentum]